MGIEEKAKAYDEALKHFKAFKEKYYTKDTNLGDVIFDKTGEMQKDFEEIFPELRESEDERIRKKLYHTVLGTPNDSTWFDGTSKEAMLTWLEKQKEQPTDAKSERVIKAARSVLNNWLDGTDCPDVSGDFAELDYAIREYDGEEKQKEQKPSWSEEDEKILDSLIRLYSMEYSEYVCPWANDTFTYGDVVNFLKSLRPSWKPSEEQMTALDGCLEHWTGNKYQKEFLESLYEQLKKL